MKLDKAYKSWIKEVKEKIRSAQLKAAVTVNRELIFFYWDLGKTISQKLEESSWGDKVLKNISKDLKEEFPLMSGLSATNLKYCRRFYDFYKNEFGQQPVDQLENAHPTVQQSVGQSQNKALTKVQQLVAQIPWGHNILIFSKADDLKEAFFYVQKTIENNWSRNVLGLQIESGLYNRKGKSISNFKATLPAPLSDLAQETLKDPYVFDFLQLNEKYREKDVENQLIRHLSKFLLELGKGFAFIGQQYPLKVADNDYYLDLLFYHTRLKCYVVIELKNTRFQPEFTGKLNFYLSAVDDLVKMEDDNPTIGILLCKEKNNIEAEFALRDMKKPIGISDYQIVKHLPKDLKSALPTIEEIENQLKRTLNEEK